MIRNLDMVALRAFVTTAELGSVTRAAGYLHLTQSAVSMQLKRLEDSLDQKLFDRVGKQLTLTQSGLQLLSFGRRILALNDEVWQRMTNEDFEGALHIGVPSDLIYPHFPTILKQFAETYPRMQLHLHSGYTKKLKPAFEAGELDLLITTELSGTEGAELLATTPLVWYAATGGVIWKSQPLRVAFEEHNLFWSAAQSALDGAGTAWQMLVNTETFRTVEAVVSADLAVHAGLRGYGPMVWEEIDHKGGLPALPDFKINLYVKQREDPVSDHLARSIRRFYKS